MSDRYVCIDCYLPRGVGVLTVSFVNVSDTNYDQTGVICLYMSVAPTTGVVSTTLINETVLKPFQK